MSELLASLPKNEDPSLLVGFGTSDDAGVYRLTDDLAIITTADFITPPVDDPFVYGQVAAANAISDVYAMGGRPVTCLNLVCFPSKKLPPEQLHGIVSGALSKITEAGAVLAGGHSVEDSEPKFGLAVTGVVHPDRVWENRGAKPGDALVLTKPIGTGVLFNAHLKGWVSPRALEACLDSVTALNRTAAEVAAAFTVHGATDITGFGLGGHGLELAEGSGATIEIELDVVPLLDEAVEMYRRGVTTGVNRENRRQVEPKLELGSGVDPERPEVELLFDPQTSGGLLLSVPADESGRLVEALQGAGVSAAARIGRVVEADAPGTGREPVRVRVV